MSEERVNTGGTIDILHSGEYKLDEERENAIKEAYKRADERKKRERIYWIIGVLIMILIFGIGAFLLFR